MPELKIKLEINKGRRGVPLKRLVKVANEARKFLEMFAKDIGLGEGEWLAERLTNGSAAFDTTFVGETPSRALTIGQKALDHITSPDLTADDLQYGIQRETFFQFGKIASPLPADDAVYIGLYNGKPEPDMRQLSRARYLEIERQIVERVKQYGGVKGVITALFRGANTIWVHELSTGAKVVCQYEKSKYDKIWKLLDAEVTVINVEGWITDKPGEDRHLEIETVSPATEYQEGDLEKFFGVDPDFTGDLSTDEYVGDLRGETTEEYLERLSDE